MSNPWIKYCIDCKARHVTYGPRLAHPFRCDKCEYIREVRRRRDEEASSQVLLWR